MKIDDILIEASARNHLWATISHDGETMVLSDYRHSGELRVNWEGDVLWLTHSSGEQVGISTTFPQTIVLDTYLPGMFSYFAHGGDRPDYPPGVLVAPPAAPISDFPSDITEDDNLPPVGDTTRKQVIEARVGQGVYRERLLAKWDNACAVTGLGITDFLVASHARPWKGGDNNERLDGDNGLPLVPNLDKLFDRGFITFDDDGQLCISTVLPPVAYEPMGVKAGMHLIKPLNEKQKKYMSYHRNNVFKG